MMSLLELRLQLGCQVLTKSCAIASMQTLLFHCAVAVGPGGRASITTPSSQTAAGPASSDNTVAIIGGVVAVVIVVVVIVIAITVLIAITLILRSRRAEFNPNQK